MVLNAVSPNLTNSNQTPRRKDIVDTLLVLRDVGAAALSATGVAGPVSFEADAQMSYSVNIDMGALTGYTAGTNQWTAVVEASSDGTTFVEVANIGDLGNVAVKRRVPVEGSFVETQLSLASQGSAQYIRVTFTKAGTVGDLTAVVYVTCE